MSSGDEKAITHGKECVVRLSKGSRKNTTLCFSWCLMMHDGIGASNTYLPSTRYKHVLCYRHGDAWRIGSRWISSRITTTGNPPADKVWLFIIQKQNPSARAVTPEAASVEVDAPFMWSKLLVKAKKNAPSRPLHRSSLHLTHITLIICECIVLCLRRYLAIRYPLRSRELRTPCNAVVAMVVIWGLSLVFAGPYLSYYDLIDYANSTVCIPGWEEQDRKVLDTCTFMFGYVIPVLIVSLSYTRTIKYLWTAVDPLDGMSESKRAKRKVTKMIIIVTVLFCICWLPYHVVILCYLYGDFPFNQTTYAFRLLSHCMAYANSCVNPIVYALVSKHFRKGFKKVFSCILSKKGRNKVHVVHVANTVPGFEAGSTEVSHMNEEHVRQNECEMINRPMPEPREATVTLNLPFQRQTWQVIQLCWVQIALCERHCSNYY